MGGARNLKLRRDNGWQGPGHKRAIFFASRSNIDFILVVACIEKM